MLLGRFEWAVGVVGVAVVVTIVSWYSVVWSRGGLGRSEPSGPPRSQVVRPAPGAPPEAAPAPNRTPPAPRSAAVRLVAVRGDSWLQVRRGSPSGPVLYDGTLVRGRSLRLRSPRLWVRFGSASNLNLHVDGVLVSLPLFGTYDAFVTPRGVRPDPVLHVVPAQATAAQSP